MPGLGDDSVHRSYDDIARELRRAASRLSAPLALAARNRRTEAEKALRLERDELARLVGRGTPGSQRATEDVQQWTRSRQQTTEHGAEHGR